MNYVFEFSQVFEAWDELLAGALRTLWLSGASMGIGLVVAVLGALGKTNGPRWLRWIIDAYIEVIRNTPFLIQIFMVFFGLPAIGVRLEADEAALLALVINVGAYGIEIIRAGIESIHSGQIEAGRACRSSA
jgi:polar amino acid transport system permease protein